MIVHASSEVGGFDSYISQRYGPDPDGQELAVVERYDGEAWEAVADLPVDGCTAAAAAVLQDHVHLIGGCADNGGDGEVLRDHLRYSPDTNTWHQLAPMPTARACLAAAVVSNQLYAIGARVDSNYGRISFAQMRL